MSKNPVRKVALLIGVGEYGEGLPPLQCPAKGVEAMQNVLGNADIGGFEVVPSVNPDVGEMRALISDTFTPLRKDDLALLYFTGHGVKTITDNFYLTTAQTKLFENGQLSTGTAIEADFVKQVLRDCNAARKIVILDCCFGAAFADGFLTMDDGSMNVEDQLGGKGWCVMTAATSRRYALEQVGEELSVYTRYLVEGLNTGGAALDGREYVSVQHWHEYVKQRVAEAAPTMEPAIFNGIDGESIWIAKAQVDNEQRYRKQVQKKVGKGRISAPAQMELEQYWQPLLEITSEQAKKIENEVLKPYREQEKHLIFYAEALKAEKTESYPFEQDVVDEFKSLQRTFSLTDEDVQAKELEILGERMRVLHRTPKRKEEINELEEKTFDVKALNLIFKTEQVNIEKKVEATTDTTPQEVEYFTERLGNGSALSMMLIPGGKFMMGAREEEEEASPDEYPQHEVSVPAFWISNFAITQRQWAGIAKLSSVRQELKQDPSYFKGKDRPVEQISWLDAVEFCARLSNKSKRYYSLPSEAQWEYANSAEIKPFGMCANMWEWCADDWHDSYENAPDDGSAWISGKLDLPLNNKVLKGGSSYNYPVYCRTTDRFKQTLNHCDNFIGFRVVCSIV